MLEFSQTAHNFFTILSLHKEDNISVEMSLSRQYAALVCKTAFMETQRKGTGDIVKSDQKLARRVCIWCYISQKRLVIFS